MASLARVFPTIMRAKILHSFTGVFNSLADSGLGVKDFLFLYPSPRFTGSVSTQSSPMWEGLKSFTDMRLIFNEIACMVKEVKEKVKIIGVIRAREGACR